MSRLTFRAWDGEQMVSPDYVDRDGYAHWKANSIPEGTDRVMQWTGLLDKRGAEVFEGDILGGIWEGGWIAYCDKCKGFEYFAGQDGCFSCLGDVRWRDIVEDEGKLEVIGNIYVNPERMQL
ncbi:hypothetical protein LCGC14_0369720 [marine sediment metagenome]|uniref:YopX protein domain-containing protein n=1 Tax=marine sediment metagenome TaxID=412755 RepID=A0A0F9WDZ9_9ZZZZ